MRLRVLALHRLVFVEWEIDAIPGGLPLRRVHVVNGGRSIVALGAFKLREVLHVGPGHPLPRDRQVLLDAQQSMAGRVVAGVVV